MNSNIKLLAASGDLEFSIFWSNGKGTHLDAYIKERPSEKGLWVWAEEWRRPTKEEMITISKGIFPFESSDGNDK